MIARELSVVICTLGREGVGAAIGSALASIQAANVAAEVIVVWQGNTAPALPSGVRVLPTIPAGLSHARNVGIDGATGAAIGFVEDDEVVAESWAAGVLQGFADGADAVFGPVDPLDDLGRPYCELVGEEPRWIGPRERPWSVGNGGNMAASREVLTRVGGFDPRLGAGSFGLSAEDTMLIARLQRIGARLRWRPEMRVSHPTKTDAEMLASRYPYGFGAGRVVRQTRSAALGVRYGLDLARAGREAVRLRDRAKLRELAATTRGFVSGAVRRDGWTAPGALLERLPEELRPTLLGNLPRGLHVPYRTDVPHFLYAVGDDRMLHVYGAPTPAQREALRARAALEGAQLAGIPALHGAVETDTELWVVEGRLPGHAAKPVRDPRWWGAMTDLLVGLGGVTGPPVRQGGWWREARERLPAALSPAWREPVAAALEIVGEMPSVVTHGDAQPKNIVLDGDTAGLVDWDGALAEGPPGLDLLFLAVTTRTGRPDPAPLLALAAGRDEAGVPLLDALRAVGLDGPAACSAALVAAGSWAAMEARRAERSLGRVAAHALVFAALLDEVGPALARGQTQISR